MIEKEYELISCEECNGDGYSNEEKCCNCCGTGLVSEERVED